MVSSFSGEISNICIDSTDQRLHRFWFFYCSEGFMTTDTFPHLDQRPLYLFQCQRLWLCNKEVCSNYLCFRKSSNIFFFVGVCSLDNRVYCIGGTYGPSGTKYCFRLNENDSKWDRIANLHQGMQKILRNDWELVIFNGISINIITS